jgi:hypothetical protein
MVTRKKTRPDMVVATMATYMIHFEPLLLVIRSNNHPIESLDATMAIEYQR